MRGAVIAAILISALAIGCGGDRSDQTQTEIDLSLLTEGERKLVESIDRLRAEVEAAVEGGLRWLEGRQGGDGSLPGGVGNTALAVWAFLDRPVRDEADRLPSWISRAVSYIASNINPDGSISSSGRESVIQTAQAVIALSKLGEPSYRSHIRSAIDFLKAEQAENGGFPAGEGGEPDIVTTAFALLALEEAGLSPDEAVWRRAISFVQSCHHYADVNDAPWVDNSGGFVTSPGSSEAGRDELGRPLPYGTATYAGLLCYLISGMQAYEPPVRAALKWIMNNISASENPGLGRRELGLYYFMLSKALSELGEYIIIDSNGVQHRWFEGLFAEIKAQQSEDGFWSFEEPVRDTALVVLALEAGYPRRYPIPGLEFRMRTKIRPGR